MTSTSQATAKSTSVEELQSIASQVRRDIVRMVHGCQSGHPGGSLGCTDFLVALYFHQMRHDAENFTMDGIGEDLFFLSNGHIKLKKQDWLQHFYFGSDDGTADPMPGLK